jgi:phosphoribosyl-ATP pyrophosphohydrolase
VAREFAPVLPPGSAYTDRGGGAQRRGLAVQSPISLEAWELTGEHGISNQEVSVPEPHPLDRLFATIESRRTAEAQSSYTAELFSHGVLKIAKKVGEEGVETALAAVAQDSRALARESADLLYHLLVLWAACGMTPQDVYAVLAERAERPAKQRAKPD